MRTLTSILFFIAFSLVYAEEFTVFEQGGYYGIKDHAGTVTVPPVYEKLGWSDGTTEVQSGVIGFKQNNSWGLITVRNKALTEQKFYTIVPISGIHFKASIKGKFSNKLFHGILDEKGRTLVSFNYFTINTLGENWLVSDFDGKQQLFGVVSSENEIIVSCKYKSVKEYNRLFIAEQLGGKFDLYLLEGVSLLLGLDSLSLNSNGYIGYRDGYAGFLSSAGRIIHDFDYKSFSLEGSEALPIPFPEWKIYKEDTQLLSWRCDSLSVSENDLLIAHINGSHHLLLKNETLLSNHELILKEVANHQLIVQNSKSREWSVLNDDGSILIKAYDSIHAVGDFYAAKNGKGWNLHSNTGELRNRFPFQELKTGVEGQFVVRRNGHWGILNNQAEEVTTYKYDSIVADVRTYSVSYLNMWGIMNSTGEWIIRPAYQELFIHNDILIGRRGRGYSVHSEGALKFKTTAKPIERAGSFIIMEGEDKKLGLLSDYGEMIIHPFFDSIQSVGDHFVLFDSSAITLIKKTGAIILKPEEKYQAISGFNEGYFSVKRENRWGFVDDEGRLRISNRYDDVRPFREGLAPFMIRGKWGFINKEEEISIQPYYHSVSTFNDGVSIVHINEKYGLIDSNGSEVLELIWKSIFRLPTGNYLVQDIDGYFGLVNSDGRFILRPEYDHLEDFGNRILVSKRNAWGVLDYTGQQIFKINHEEIKVVRNFTMVKS